MATIKGKWRFNNAVTPLTWLNEYQIENVNFTSNGEHFTDIYWNSIPDPNDDVYHIYYADTLAVRGYYGNISSWENEAYKTIEFDGEQEVSDNFLAWMQENATRQAERTPTAESVTNNIIGLISSANATTGKNDHTLNDAVISLMAGYGQGVGGECPKPHVVDVDELPEVGVEGAVYKCQGKLYEYSTAFQDLIISQEGESMSFADIFGALGITIKCYCHTLPTKPTEMPVLSQDGIDLFYIEDENDIFLCGESDGQIQWVTFREALGSDTDVDVGSFLGTITDISEATENGYYALCPPWIPYVHTSGTLDIAENGEYDVAETEKVKVEVPSKFVVGKRRFNDWPTMSLPYISQKVNFTAMYEGKLAKCVEMGAGPSGMFLEDRIHYYLEDGGGGSVFSLGWYYEDSRMVDFGNTPQIVSDKFAEFIENNTEPVYDHIDNVASETEMIALLETAEVGSIYKYTGTTTETYENGALYQYRDGEFHMLVEDTDDYDGEVAIVTGGSGGGSTGGGVGGNTPNPDVNEDIH